MSENTIILKVSVIAAVACALWIWYLVHLWKSTNKIFFQLEEVRELVKNAYTLEELNKAWDSLTEIKKKCSNYQQLADIIEISAIINNKREMLCQKEK